MVSGGYVGRYRLVRRVGEGGMGVVWAAEDPQLGRTVALKTLAPQADAEARERLWREARTAASVSHPNLCQLFDVLEEDGRLYLAMELLAGETLADRLVQGRLGVDEAVRVATGVLAGLATLHERGIVHRDLKPSNIFLTPHGVKVLDFGLALPATEMRLTSPGVAMGTPQYMAPEQWRGESVTSAADVFACGAIVFEMLAGRPAFRGDSVANVCHAVLHEHPAALTGGPRVDAVGRVVTRALAKRARDRHASATVMAAALGADAEADRGETRRMTGIAPLVSGSRAELVRRLIVLPFRLLRPDPEVDFLGHGLADAITVALGGIPTLALRSPYAASGLGPAPDLQRLSRELEVDAVLSGTLLAASGRVRLSAQLIEAPGGTVLGSTSADATMADVFRLQDELVRAVVEALALRLSPQQDRRLAAGGSVDGRAFELYLRANEVGATISSAARQTAARDLYQEAVAEDPGFAPAWARLGRIYRVMGKYGHGEAEPLRELAREAFARALELDPDLPLAHDLYTYFEVEEHGALAAVERLLGRVRTGAAGAETYVGLVVACRFCGLLEASRAAHDEARRRDPKARTSVHYTLFLLGELEQAVAEDEDEAPAVRLSALAMLDRREELAQEWLRLGRRELRGHHELLVNTWRAAIEGRSREVQESAEVFVASGFRDPEGLYFWGRALVHGGAHELGLEVVERAVESGFHFAGIAEDPWLASLGKEPRFQRLVAIARAGYDRAVLAFEAAGGALLLGLTAPPPRG
jgi:TolB-like protein